MSVAASLNHRTPSDDGTLAGEIRTLRHYSEAKATIRIQNESTINRLREKNGLVRGKLTQNKLQLIAAQAPLTRDERICLISRAIRLVLQACCRQVMSKSWQLDGAQREVGRDLRSR